MATTNTAQSAFAITINGKQSIIMDNDDVIECIFIEDIFSYLMTGSLLCRDTRGITEFLPLVGNETVTIEYGTTLGGSSAGYETKKQTFNIIKAANVENTQDKRRHLIKFFFIASPHRRLQMEHYSRSYKCMLYTDIVSDILERHAGMSPGMFINSEICTEILQYFYTGLKTPAQNVEWLLNRCSSASSGQPGWLLYSSSQDEGSPYNLRTLETMLQQTVQIPPNAGYYTIADNKSEYNINKFIKYTDGRVDKKSLERMIHYKNVGFDIHRKKYLINEYTYQDALARFTCLGDYSLFEEGTDSIVSTAQELSGEFDEEAVMKNIYFGDWIKRYCLQHTVSTILEGHSDRYCGGVIQVMWPSANDEDIYDKNMDGVFLVKSITHSFVPFQKPVYTQKMILIKNGYNETDGNLTAAAKSNTEVIVVDDSGGVFDNANVRGV
jgi:hypothetical protein